MSSVKSKYLDSQQDTGGWGFRRISFISRGNILSSLLLQMVSSVVELKPFVV